MINRAEGYSSARFHYNALKSGKEDEMAEIIIRGRTIPLLYTTWEMKTVQEEIAPLATLYDCVLGRNPEDEEDTSGYATPEHLEAIGKLIRILGNAGLEENGEKPDLTDKWIMRGLKPGMMVGAINKCLDAMNEGMLSEIPKEKKQGRVDVTLEEMNKKKEPGD